MQTGRRPTPARCRSRRATRDPLPDYALSQILRCFDAGGDGALRLLRTRRESALCLLRDRLGDFPRARDDTASRRAPAAPTSAAPLRGALATPARTASCLPAGRLPPRATARRRRARRRPTTLPRRLPATLRAALSRRSTPAGLPARPTLGSRHTSFPGWKKLARSIARNGRAEQRRTLRKRRCVPA